MVVDRNFFTLISQLDRQLDAALGHEARLMSRTYRDARALWSLRRAIENATGVARELRLAVGLVSRAPETETDHAR